MIAGLGSSSGFHLGRDCLCAAVAAEERLCAASNRLWGQREWLIVFSSEWERVELVQDVKKRSTARDRLLCCEGRVCRQKRSGAGGGDWREGVGGAMGRCVDGRWGDGATGFELRRSVGAAAAVTGCSAVGAGAAQASWFGEEKVPNFRSSCLRT
jgi:hypothetical protein